MQRSQNLPLNPPSIVRLLHTAHRKKPQPKCCPCDSHLSVDYRGNHGKLPLRPCVLLTLRNHIPTFFRISANPASFSKKSSPNWEGPRVCQTLVFHVLNRKENAYPSHKEQQEVLPQAWLATTTPHSLSFQTFCSINRLKSDNKNILQPLNRREKKK